MAWGLSPSRALLTFAKPVRSAASDPAEDKTFERVFRRADQAMYARKQELKAIQKGKPILRKG